MNQSPKTNRKELYRVLTRSDRRTCFLPLFHSERPCCAPAIRVRRDTGAYFEDDRRRIRHLFPIRESRVWTSLRRAGMRPEVSFLFVEKKCHAWWVVFLLFKNVESIVWGCISGNCDSFLFFSLWYSKWMQVSFLLMQQVVIYWTIQIRIFLRIVI